jgi:hypothetical protein
MKRRMLRSYNLCRYRRRRRRGQAPLFEGQPGKVRLVTTAGFVPDVLQVTVDSAHRDIQLTRNVGGAFTIGD